MNLVIDIGNTFAKAAWFEGTRLIDSVHCRRAEEADILHQFLTRRKADACAVSCVAASTADIDSLLDTLTCPLLRITGQTSVPFRNTYRTPHTLGSDRLCAVAGAMTLMPDTNVLVADIGTCLTLDVLDKRGKYLGGNISPGPSMRFAALHEGTARLPLVSQEGDCPLTGYDTETAMRSGVLYGIALEIEGYARRLRETMPDLTLIVTGGKSRLLFPLIHTGLQAVHEPNLVETGLNAILVYNMNQHSAQQTEQHHI